MLAQSGGTLIPGASFDVQLTGGVTGAFSVADDVVTATTTPGTATMTVTFGTAASCTATLVNLGPTPGGSSVRIFVFDWQDGSPIQDAQLIVDTNNDGSDDGSASNTGAAGTTTATIGSTGSYGITVFKAGYHYLSVVGLPASSVRDVALPLRERRSPPMTGGFSGKIDFSSYEQVVLGGLTKTIKMAFVSQNVSLASLTEMNSTLLWGSKTEANCNDIPHPAGCYNVSIPGLIEDLWVPIAGGVVMTLASTPMKSHFDVAANPGLRYAQALGGEMNISDIAGIMSSWMAMLGICDCDAASGVCDPSCACDADCGDSLLTVLADFQPLFASFASAAHGNLQLPGVLLDDWENYIADPYFDRVDSGGNFALLDSNGLGKLDLREPLSVFSDLSMPNLPLDPEFTDGTTFDGILIYSGVVVPGSGLVPLGVSAGLDCTEGDCSDRVGNAAAFDGVVNGALQCFYDPDPAYNGCPPTVPTSALADGRIGLFRARPHAGLQGLSWRTAVIALPRQIPTEAGYRSTAFLLPNEPPSGSTNFLANGVFAGFPAIPAQVNNRTYPITPAANIDAHWLTLMAPPDGNGVRTEWEVFFADASGAFVAPAVPGGWDDPISQNAGSAVPTRHAGVKFVAGTTVEGLIRNNSSKLVSFDAHLAGFSVQRQQVPVP